MSEKSLFIRLCGWRFVAQRWAKFAPVWLSLSIGAVLLLPILSCPGTAVGRRPTVIEATAPAREVTLARGIHVKGVNYDDDSLDKAIALGWEWIKIYDHPPAERLPFKVLYRVNLPRPDEDWNEWANYRRIDAELYAGRIDAYEIGNEPNLSIEWGGPPDPAAYAELLKLAYRTIKAADPNALIVSAGLSPVNAADPAQAMNDLDFLRQMYAHGAKGHFDVLGVHPFGFAYPPEIEPDGVFCRPPLRDRDCTRVDGQSFRRAEWLRQIMVEAGDAETPMWATEFGWIIRPPVCCWNRSDWPVWRWQAVSEGTQAAYILRAFAYAEANWPWMEVMFLWNLDFSRYTPSDRETCPPCETMGWFSILNPDGSPRQAYRRLLTEERPLGSGRP